MARRRRPALGPRGALTLLAVAAACRAPQATPSPASSQSASSVRSGAVPAGAPSPSVAPSSAASSQPAVPSPSALPRPLAPLPQAGALVSLPVSGFRDAIVSLPLGATTPRVVVLALHGNFDRPEWQCEVWRRITRADVFVLCPRGIPRSDVPKELDRWEWGSVAKTKSEIVAALDSLRARYPQHVKPGPVVFTGFSLGAILGARLLQDPELPIAAAVLIEGGYQGWTLAKAKSLKPRLRGLLFACGQSECRNTYRYQLAHLFERADLPSSLVEDTKAGHTYDDPLAALVQGAWPALMASLESE
jgi:dienelactone hydrolase